MAKAPKVDDALIAKCIEHIVALDLRFQARASVGDEGTAENMATMAGDFATLVHQLRGVEMEHLLSEACRIKVGQITQVELDAVKEEKRLLRDEDRARKQEARRRAKLKAG
jgi:hypothetical protein